MVLIIEDDDISGRLLIKLFQEFFPEIEYQWLRTVGDSINYISKYKSTGNDFILLDLYLTDGDAWDILDRIKSGSLNFHGKVVLMPGIKPNKEETLLIDKYLPYKVIVKPIDLKDLKDILYEKT